MNISESETKNPDIPQSQLVVYFLVVGLLWVSFFFPESRLWGVNWYRYFSWYGLTALMVIGLGLPLIVSRLTGRSVPGAVRSEGSDGRYRVAILAGSLTSVVVFTLLRGRTHFLGDGYQVLAKVQAGSEVIKPWDRATWSVQKAIYLLFGGSGESAALVALQALSVLCGLLFVLALSIAARRLFDSVRDRILFILFAGSGGYMLLFFGYVENYPLLVLSVTAFALAGLLVAREFWPRWVLLIPLAISLLLHPFGASLIPAAAYLLFRRTPLARKWSKLSTHTKYALVGVPTLIGILALYHMWHSSYFFRFALVPFRADRFTVEGYTMLSCSHLLDYANLLLMLAPGLPLTLGVLYGLPIRSIFKRADYRFLLLLMIACLTIIFMFNPRLGMPRDWDLFCFAGLPVVLLSAYLVLDSRNAVRSRSVVALLSIGLGLLVLGPRVVSQALPETSIEVFDHFAELDVIKSRNGRFLLQEYLEKKGQTEEHRRRAVINMVKLPHERLSEAGRRLGDEGQLREAIAKFRRAIDYDPTYHYSWANLGVVYRWMGKYDSALVCLRIADGLNPYCFSNYMKLAGTYYGSGNLEQAEKYWDKAARLQADDFECRTYLLRLYRDQERQMEYENLLAGLLAGNDLPVEALGKIARLQLDHGELNAAASVLQRALREGLDTTTILELQQQYPSLHVLD